MKLSVLSILSLCLLFSVKTAQGQQQVSFMQYHYNALAINPAYAGYFENLTFNFSDKFQYHGFEGSPNSTQFSMHGKVRERVGLGGIFNTDRIGVTSKTGLYGSYAFQVISKNPNPYTNWEFSPHILSFGLQAGFTYYKEDLVSLNATQDPNFANNTSFIIPNLGIGMYYSKNAFYISISAPQILSGRFENQDAKHQVKPHVYIGAGNKLRLSPIIKLHVTTLLRWVNGAPFQFDLNSIFSYHSKLNLGIGYTSNSSINFMGGFFLNRSFLLGYHYAMPIRELRASSLGYTHEIMLNFIVPTRKKNF